MTVIGTTSQSATITRSGRIVGRAKNSGDSYPAFVVYDNAITNGNGPHAWKAVSPYTSWTDLGLVTPVAANAHASQAGASVPVDIDGVQNSSPSNNACYGLNMNAAIPDYADSYGAHAAYASASWGTFAVQGADYTDAAEPGPKDVVVLPNGHVWHVATDATLASIYANPSAFTAISVGSAATPTGTQYSTGATDGGGLKIVTTGTTLNTQPIVPKIGYSNTSSYRVWVFYNDGAGNLKYIYWTDAASYTITTTGPTQLAASGVSGSDLSVTEDTAGNLHIAAANSNGIQYWYVAAGSTTINGPYSISASTNDTQPALCCIGSSTVVCFYRHYTGTTNKYNIISASATIVTSGSPTWGADVTVYTDAGTNGAAYPCCERISADAANVLVCFTTGTATPWSVNAVEVTPTGQSAGLTGTDSATLTDAATDAGADVASDSGALTDAAAEAGAWGTTDSATLTDTASMVYVVVLTGTDSATLTDNAVEAGAWPATDSATLSDSATKQDNLAGSDSASLTDTAAMSGMAGTDSGTLTDAATEAWAEVGTDSGTLTDGAVMTGGSVLTGTDSVSLTDAAIETGALPAADSGALTDSATQASQLASTDAALLADAATEVQALSSADAASLTDAAGETGAWGVTDSASLSASAVMAYVVVLTGTDSATLTEASQYFVFPAMTGTDSATLTDSATEAGALVAPDGATLTDSATMAYTLVAMDSAMLTDTATQSGTLSGNDAGSLTDAAPLAGGLTGSDAGALTDGASEAWAEAASDAFTLTDRAGFGMLGSDSGTLTESSSMAWAEAAVDALTLADIATLAAALVAADTGTLTDAATMTYVIALTGTDSATLTDSALSSGGLTGTDGATLVDSAAQAGALGGSDSGGLTDGATEAGALAGSDSGSLTDSASMVYGGVTLTGADSFGLTDSATMTWQFVAVDGLSLTELVALAAAISASDSVVGSATAVMSGGVLAPPSPIDGSLAIVPIVDGSPAVVVTVDGSIALVPIGDGSITIIPL